jgi:hypothetical protein
MGHGRAALGIALAAACGGSLTISPADDAGPGGAPLAPRSPPCPMRLAGDPAVILSLPQRNASAPELVVLDPGSDTRDARVAIQALANSGTSGLPDDIEVARATVTPPWPAGMSVDEPPQLDGEFAIGAGQMDLSGSVLALAWHRETTAVGRPQFRALDPATWSLSEPVQVAASGDAVLSFVAGDGGYAVAWRDVNAPGVGPARPLVAVVDTAGSVILGPLPAAAQEDYPGRSPALSWSGTSYLLATSFADCHRADPLCVANSVTVSRLEGNPPGLVLGGSFAPLDPASRPGTSAVATLALPPPESPRVWIAWSEGTSGDASVAHTIRVARVDASGTPEADPVTVATGAHPSTRLSLAAGDLGLFLAWAEGGAGASSENQPGSSIVVVAHLDADGRAVEALFLIPATFVDAEGPPRTVTLGTPRSALVTWGGRSTDPTQPDVAWAARLDCSP